MEFVTYTLWCQECGDEVAAYKGETGKNAYSRGVEHLEHLEANDEDKSLFWLHSLHHHQSRRDVKYGMKVTGAFQDPLDRQIMEKIQIQNFKGEEQTSQGAMLSNGGSTIFQKRGVIKIDLGRRSPWWSGRQEGRPSGWWDNNNMQPAWASLIICLTNRRRWHLSRAPGSPIHQKRILEEHYFCSVRRGLVPDGGRSY